MALTKTFFYITPRDSVVRRLNPLTKGSICLLLSLAPFIGLSWTNSDNIIFLFSLISAVIVMLIVAKVTLRHISLVRTPLMTLGVLLFIGQGLIGTTPGEGLVFDLWIIKIYSNHLLTFLLWYSRFICSIFGVLFLLSTSTIGDLIAIGRIVHLPYALSFIWAMIFRGFYTFADDFTMILQAQKGRGMDIDRMKLLQKAKNYAGVLLPLLLIELQRTGNISNSAESRALSFSRKRTDFMLSKYRYRRRDLVITSFVATLFALFIISNFVNIRSLFLAW
ncbi:MAG TPA: energy-coupling factor transporter transmembrane component T [Candidatus Bathyarchaeia archaeon]|nr:energy-coupling factor transporter transmembrane component T [Candidatus Bathyarchaeia archaeon]